MRRLVVRTVADHFEQLLWVGFCAGSSWMALLVRLELREARGSR